MIDTAVATTIYFKGLVTTAGLIIAIGAQNAFLLGQALRRQYHWPIALLCCFFDIALISLGVAGMGLLITRSPLMLQIVSWGGIVFLSGYGALALRAAFDPGVLRAAESGPQTLKAALLTTVAVTLLNPHAWLDTVVLLGGIGGRYALDERMIFVAGCVTASIVWFCGLAAGAKWLAPLFKKPLAWRVLDVLIAAMMWTIAGLLLVDTLALG
ncbi:amino acid transporter [Gammaproteobacteria bacterium LSUCC0057]|uniref:Amino acid transporter n=1 Tax=Gammaproteobacteria bacterium LSUCC0057 TaxID=2559237 RepID=A0A4Y8UGL4_9GAMM|nr:amino acid transporter [Gammaproteobacteria bacterium LSUCC0057]